MKHSPAFLQLVEEVMPRVREISIEDMLAWLERTLPPGPSRLDPVSMQVVPTEKALPPLVVDVREESEFAAGHLPGAVHMGRGVIERDIEEKIPDKATPMVLYCGGGYRSALSADSLQKMGYTNVYSMAGGWRSWCDKGLSKA